MSALPGRRPRPAPRAGRRAARRAGALLAAVVVLAACSAASPTPDPSPPRIVTATGSPWLPGTWGVSPGYRVLDLSDEDLAVALDRVAGSGARWLRVDLDWSRVEAEPGGGDWAAPDRVVAAARARGLQVLALPGYAPDWAADPGRGPDPAAYAAFVARAVARYAPAGVRAWELWNEPNLASAWGAPPDPGAYAALLRAAAAAAVAVDPGAVVLAGGLAPARERRGSSAAAVGFLAAVAEEGAVPGLAGVAVHPYVYPALPQEAAPGPTNLYANLPILHASAVRLAGSAARVWATELGAPTGTDARAVTPQAQALTLVQADALLAARPWSGPAMVYSDQDAGDDPAQREDNFGLVDSAGRPKPAWSTFVALAAVTPGAARR